MTQHLSVYFFMESRLVNEVRRLSARTWDDEKTLRGYDNESSSRKPHELAPLETDKMGIERSQGRPGGRGIGYDLNNEWRGHDPLHQASKRHRLFFLVSPTRKVCRVYVWRVSPASISGEYIYTRNSEG